MNENAKIFLAVLVSVTVSHYGLGVHQLIMLSWVFVVFAGILRLMPEKRTETVEKSE